MTISDFSKAAGLTPQAIYKRLKENGISLSEIREQDGKTLTGEGLSTLATLFKVKQIDNLTPETYSGIEKKAAAIEKKLEALEDENAQLKLTLTELRATAAAKDQLIENLQGQLLFMQQLQAATLQRIPTAKPTLWQRITGKVKPSTESK